MYVACSLYSGASMALGSMLDNPKSVRSKVQYTDKLELAPASLLGSRNRNAF